MHKTCRKTGGLRLDAQWRDYLAIDYDNPVYVNPNFGTEGMRYWYKRAYVEYYTSPSTWKAILATMRTRDDLLRIARMARAGAARLTHGVTDFFGHQFGRLAHQQPTNATA